MKLVSAHVTNFKSIEDSDEVPIDPEITVLVGQNESGKTAFLQSLYKARDIEGVEKFDYVEDYPRRLLNDYTPRHGSDPAVAVVLTFRLSDAEIAAINTYSGIQLITALDFSITFTYANKSTVKIEIDERPYIAHRVTSADLSTEVKAKVLGATNVVELISLLNAETLNATETAFLADMEAAFPPTATWDNRSFEHYIYQHYISPTIPKFLYFDDYFILPGKINLQDLAEREAAKTLHDQDRTALSLLRLANVSLEELRSENGYESVRSKLEGISNSITDKLFNFWKQNDQLDVEFDVRDDPKDEAPFNQGKNLYIRIRNRRHRVTVPFNQRSKGFIWFFSFIAWFDSIQKTTTSKVPAILLLDEPGLSLHALAQADFLRYIDSLSTNHQIIYTTHSPFMVHSDRLHQVRTVQDKPDVGTKISKEVSSSSPETLFPLQAALGYTIAQNLFIAKRNLLVEGIADLIYLNFFSEILKSLGREGLHDEAVITPGAGVGKIPTFISLIGANKLDLVVLHDYNGAQDPGIEQTIQDKLIAKKKVLNYGEFRGSTGNPHTDVEDIMSPGLYLDQFNGAYKKELAGVEIKAGDLPTRDRVIGRIDAYLIANNISLRPSGGFSHYRPANYLASNPPTAARIDATTLNRFEEIFKKVNSLFDN
jgi:hypothetical protein